MVPIDFYPYVLAALAGALVVQLIAFVASNRMQRVDVVDVAWGMSFVAGVLAMQFYRPTAQALVLLVDLFVLAWGTRLAWHIYKRLIRSNQQDERYTKLMSKWPKQNRTAQTLVKIFFVQAVLAVAVGLPVVVIHYYQPSIDVVVALGALLWVIGYGIEALADDQLRQFLQTAKPGTIMQSGIWRYSRHPNYFGEITMWWGIAVMTFVTPLWWLGAIGASFITYLLCFVSGVPLAEERATKKAGWLEYKRKTSVLIPWPPKK